MRWNNNEKYIMKFNITVSVEVWGKYEKVLRTDYYEVSLNEIWCARIKEILKKLKMTKSWRKKNV